MSDTQSTPVADLIDRTAVDADGDKIGTIFDVYLDNQSGQPAWLAVETGLFGSKVSFVPIEGAAFVDDDVMVAYSKDQVKDAPKMDADGQLSPEEEQELYRHYGLQSTSTAGTGGEVGTGDQGHDTSGPETDDAMTRSEEQLDVSTSTKQTGTARLRKWIETEDVQFTVPVRREKVKMVTEPVTDANRDAAMAGADLTEDEHEITLSEEVVDVSKHVEAKERVRLEKDVETDEVTVDEQVRKERVGMDDDTDNR